METERIALAVGRVERMLSRHFEKAPKEFTEDLVILVTITKQFLSERESKKESHNGK